MKFLPALMLAATLLGAGGGRGSRTGERASARSERHSPRPPTGLPTLTFGILLSTGMFGETPPRNGFVINSIIFGAIGFAYGAILLYANASQGNEPAG